jgi:hypothetical protein
MLAVAVHHVVVVVLGGSASSRRAVWRPPAALLVLVAQPLAADGLIAVPMFHDACSWGDSFIVWPG